MPLPLIQKKFDRSHENEAQECGEQVSQRDSVVIQ